MKNVSLSVSLFAVLFQAKMFLKARVEYSIIKDFIVVMKKEKKIQECHSVMFQQPREKDDLE